MRTLFHALDVKGRPFWKNIDWKKVADRVEPPHHPVKPKNYNGKTPLNHEELFKFTKETKIIDPKEWKGRQKEISNELSQELLQLFLFYRFQVWACHNGITIKSKSMEKHYLNCN